MVGYFYDPIANYMDLVFSKLPNVAIFTLTSICSYEYTFNMEFLFHLLCSFHIFIQEGMSINKILEWCYWKFVFTWDDQCNRLGVGVLHKLVIGSFHFQFFYKLMSNSRPAPLPSIPPSTHLFVNLVFT